MAARVVAETAPPSTHHTREDGCATPRKQRLTWTVVLRLAVVVGAVAATVALAVALRIAREEELAFEAAAEILEQRLDVRLAGIEAHLAGLDARLQENYQTAKPLQ